MELIFLSRGSLKYKDHALITSDFELIVDLVVNQKSNFTLNKEKINAAIGDIAILKDATLNYIGIIESIIVNPNKTIKVQLNDFKEIFNVKVPAENFSGDICIFLKNKIRQAFLDSSDSKQNLSYLTIDVNSSVQGSFAYDDDSFINILELISIVTKAYGIIVKYKVSFLRGRFQYINIIIEEVNKSTKLRYDLKAIQNLEVQDSTQYSTNKLIFYPKKENSSHKTIETFYLLKDGTVTKDKDSLNRFDYVNYDCEYYGDKDYETLSTKAEQKMCGTTSDHEISFDLAMDNNVFIPLGNLYLGSFIEFYSKAKTYSTLLTQIKFKGNFKSAHITLGEHRSNLTDKIKMLMKGSSTSSNISISGGTTNTDGGVY